MAARSRGGQVVSTLLKGQSRICSQCARGTLSSPILSRRLYSAAAAEATIPSPSPPPPLPPSSEQPATPPRQTSHAPSHYHIQSGVILTRPPLLMRELHPFEQAFFLYQKRLSERLTASFRKAFYYKTDTATELDWRIKARERRGVAAMDIGRYNPRGRLAWNDEVLVGSAISRPENIVEKLLDAAEHRVSEDGEEVAEEDRVPLERPMPRRTEADEKGDLRRLDRALDQTLYLVVRRVKGGDEKTATWGFPAGSVPTHEALHETAARVLAESAGVNMNTWIVGRVPVAALITKPVYEGEKLAEKGTKTFFLKGRIMAGQADLTNNKHQLTDFKWLTKAELEQQLPADLFRKVRGILAER